MAKFLGQILIFILLLDHQCRWDCQHQRNYRRHKKLVQTVQNLRFGTVTASLGVRRNVKNQE